MVVLHAAEFPDGGKPALSDGHSWDVDIVCLRKTQTGQTGATAPGEFVILANPHETTDRVLARFGTGEAAAILVPAKAAIAYQGDCPILLAADDRRSLAFSAWFIRITMGVDTPIWRDGRIDWTPTTADSDDGNDDGEAADEGDASEDETNDQGEDVTAGIFGEDEITHTEPDASTGVASPNEDDDAGVYGEDDEAAAESADGGDEAPSTELGVCEEDDVDLETFDDTGEDAGSDGQVGKEMAIAEGAGAAGEIDDPIVSCMEVDNSAGKDTGFDNCGSAGSDPCSTGVEVSGLEEALDDAEAEGDEGDGDAEDDRTSSL
jgi:hypothetical protein